MKRISESFEDSEMLKLKKIKKDMSWHDFIIASAESYGGKNGPTK